METQSPHRAVYVLNDEVVIPAFSTRIYSDQEIITIMGGGVSKKAREKRYEVATENPEKIKKFTTKLGISNEELKKAFKLFDRVDKDKSGEASIDEFFKIFRFEWSSFGKNIFAAMDTSGDNRIDFVEFFVGLWNYCTLEHDTLLKFGFDLFDVDGSGEIEVDEFKQLISMVHGNKNMDNHAQKLMKTFDKDKSGSISYKEFMENAKKVPSLFMQAFTLQKNMQTRTFGNTYWNNATKRRKKALPDGGDLIEIYHRLYNGEKLNRKKQKEKMQGAARLGIILFTRMTSKTKVPAYKDASRTSTRIAKKTCSSLCQCHRRN